MFILLMRVSTPSTRQDTHTRYFRRRGSLGITGEIKVFARFVVAKRFILTLVVTRLQWLFD